MGRFKEMDIEQQERILAAHKEDALRGKAVRVMTDAVYDLSTALSALRKGHVDVTAERIEFLIDEFNALIEDLEHEQD